MWQQPILLDVSSEKKAKKWCFAKVGTLSVANYNAVPDIVFCMNFVLNCHESHVRMNNIAFSIWKLCPQTLCCCASPTPLVQYFYANMYITLHTRLQLLTEDLAVK